MKSTRINRLRAVTVLPGLPDSQPVSQAAARTLTVTARSGSNSRAGRSGCPAALRPLKEPGNVPVKGKVLETCRKFSLPVARAQVTRRLTCSGRATGSHGGAWPARRAPARMLTVCRDPEAAAAGSLGGLVGGGPSPGGPGPRRGRRLPGV